MTDIVEATIDQGELCRRLCAVLKPLEMLDLVESIEEVVNMRNGFGQVGIDFKYKRVVEMSVNRTKRPGVG